MPRSPFQYAILRIVPRLERGERINGGVVLLARTLDYLGMRVHLDRERLAALAPSADPAPIADERICVNAYPHTMEAIRNDSRPRRSRRSVPF